VLKMTDAENLLFFSGEAYEVAVLEFGAICCNGSREYPRVFALD